MYRLYLLGPTTLTGPDGSDLTSVLRAPKRLALLAYLAAATPNGYRRRDTLLGLFWPESNQLRARASLRQALHHLRSELGEVLVSRGVEEVGLDSEAFWCDAVAYGQALDRGEPAEALELYRRDLLEGFFVSGAPEFERWIESERQRLRRRGCDAAWELAEAAESPIEAARWAERAARFRPLDETVLRRLMSFLSERGNQVGALRAFEAFVKHVGEEYGAAAGQETRALASEIRAQTGLAAEPGPEDGPGPASSRALPAELLHEEESGSTEMAARAEPGVGRWPAQPQREERRRFPWRSAALVSAATLLVLTLGFGAPWLSSRSTARWEFGRALQLTRDEGLEVEPALSPDGSRLVYASGSIGERHLYMRRVGGGNAVRLTEGLAGSHRSPSWSPDGERLAFVTWHGRSTRLWVTHSMGGDLRQVAESPRAMGLLSPTWSPDGSRIALKRGREIILITVESGRVEHLTDTWAPHSLAWSPSGNLIALVSGNGPNDVGNVAPSSIWLVPVAGGDPVEVVPSEGFLNWSPVWTPDGTEILFVSNRDGSRDLYGLEVDETGQPRGEPLRLTTGMGLLTFSLSADGTRIAYSTLEFSRNLFALPIPEEGQTPVPVSEARRITSGNQQIETVAVSPDSQWLAYDSDLSGNQNLFKIPVEGGDPVQLTREAGDKFGPAWSHDGRRIAYYGFAGGDREIFVMDSEGRGGEQVTHDEASCSFPDWSPDGTRLIFQHNVPGGSEEKPVLVIVENSAPGGSWSRPRAAGNHVGEAAHWSPDGRSIAYATIDAIRVLFLETGVSRVLVSFDENSAWPVWSPDGERIYFKRTLPLEEAGIWSVPANGGEPRLLVTDPEGLADRATFDTDGEVFYFPLVDRKETDIWTMEVSWDR